MNLDSTITGFIYPVVCHWGWSDTGWLNGNHGIASMARIKYNAEHMPIYDPDNIISFVDFAGSGLVHCTGGICALMGAIILGPRIGKFSSSGKRRVLRDNNYQKKL